MCERETRVLSEAEQREVQAELNRLLESPAFRNSKRCREFLEYIVQHTILGPSGALKERLLGVELFQLPQDFDTGQRTIVRVTANEVRKKLAQHYLAESGSHHSVRIELPPGSYSAEFRWEPVAEDKPVAEIPAVVPPAAETAEAEPSPPVPEPPVRPHRSARPVLAVCAAAVLLIAVVFVISRWQPAKPISVDAKSPALPVGTVPQADGDLRMIVGSANPYFDRSGRSWNPDRFFTGGAVMVRPSEKILRTLDPDIYRHLRFGEFRYDIPLEPGSYELHLHFAETGLADFISAESSGEGQRVFRVSANGKLLLNFFDVVADAAGANISDERIFRDVSPDPDGFLHLAFAPVRGSAMLSAIEVLPVSAGKVRPIRIRAGWTSAWRDTAGQQWQADSYFIGGNALVRTTNPAQQSNAIAPDTTLYTSERWGHFSYALPVAEGRYRVTLRFCEGHYGKRNSGAGGVGSRVFDVYCNGVALLRNFDVFKEAGGEGKAIDQRFAGIRPNAQGKIVLTFVPVNGMAFVNGIEVVEETR